MNVIKKILLPAVIIISNLPLLISSCSAQNYVVIPDTAFVSWLKDNGYASCMMDSLLDTTCLKVVNAKKINCAGNNIYALTGIQYFKNLDTLICNNNQLDSLPNLPSSISYFDCSFNRFVTLPANLPSSLRWLNCSTNVLASLPVLNSPLGYFDCSFNYITNMPGLPSSLTHLDCDNNLLTNLPAFPDGLTYINVSTNSGITCLPFLPPDVFTLVIYSTSIQCVFNNPNNVSSLPSCNVFNPAGCFPAGVEELKMENVEWRIFPNPSGGDFTISSSTSLNNAVVEIDNVLGERIYSATFNGKQLTVNCNQLTAGVYFVRVSNGQQQFNQKIIVQ